MLKRWSQHLANSNHMLLKKQATCEDRMIISNNNSYVSKYYLKLIEIVADRMQSVYALAMLSNHFKLILLKKIIFKA